MSHAADGRDLALGTGGRGRLCDSVEDQRIVEDLDPLDDDIGQMREQRDHVHAGLLRAAPCP